MKIFELLLVSYLYLFANVNSSKVGVGYGLQGPHKISYDAGLGILKSKGFSSLKIWSIDSDWLNAVRNVYKGSPVQVTVGIPNHELWKMAYDDGYKGWILSQLRSFQDLVDTLTIGNEPSVNNAMEFLVPAVNSARRMINENNLRMKLTVSFSGDILTDTWPIANSKFVDQHRDAVVQVLNAVNIFSVNLYPYYSYVKDRNIRLGTALGHDGSILKNMIEGVKVALGKVGKGWMPIMIGETGWPSTGGKDTTVQNEQKYIEHVYSLADMVERIFLFEAFDGEGKSGPDVVRNFGLFYSNGHEKFALPASQGSTCSLGAGYGLIGPHHVSYENGLKILKSKGMYLLKTWSIDPGWLTAVRNVYGNSAKVSVMIPNSDLWKMANDGGYRYWVLNQLKSFGDIIDILAVSNEPEHNNIMHMVVPAVRAARKLINDNQLKVKLTVAFMASVLQDTWPIESTRIADRYRGVVADVLGDLDLFSINLYTYFTQLHAPNIPLADILGERGSVLKNMILGVKVALNKMGKGNMPIIIGETGWPTAGGKNTSPDNARKFTNHVASLRGLVHRIYYFEAFDEAGKPGDPVERNFGLFYANGAPKFDFAVC